MKLVTKLELDKIITRIEHLEMLERQRKEAIKPQPQKTVERPAAKKAAKKK